MRRTAVDYGVSLGLQDTTDVFDNPSGGRARGVDLNGALEVSFGIDLGKAIGLNGGTFSVSSYETYGHGISASHIDNLNLVSSVEAVRSFWLFELWYQQSFLSGAADVRVGQVGADQEFIISQYGTVFVNSAFGWPELPSANLPAGGPNFPTATPGIRLRFHPDEPLTILLAAFNGNPAGSGLSNPEKRAEPGTGFRLGDGVFIIGEGQYVVTGGKAASGSPITIKLGGWYHSASLPTRFSTLGGTQPVATPGSAIARENYAGYAVVDTMLLLGPGGNGGLAAFARVSASPPRRSLASVELAGGLVYNGPFGRANDQAGFGITSVRIGKAQGSDGAAASTYRFLGYETVLELTYQAQVQPWLQLQPDFQYVITPGGGIPNPSQPGRKIGSAAVFGLRTTISF